jgi:integrase
MIELHEVKVRAALKPRREPYWGPAIGRGQVVGFRKINADTGSWVARMRDEAGRKIYHKLGYLTDQFGYEEARAAALKWIEGRDAGVTGESVSVGAACREYVEDRLREKGQACAHDAEMRFERTVYGTQFGATPIDKLRTPQIKAWRDGLKLGKASSNRTLTALKAALNLAVANRRVHPAASREWGDVAPYVNASRRRTLFLDLQQRRALLERLQGGLRDLVEAVMLTGARAGELTTATRAQFDARTKTMTFRGKTGVRSVPLSDAAAALFTRLSKSKLPAAPMFLRDDGRPWAHSDWDKLIREAASIAKLPEGCCLYTLRHSFVTEAISQGLTTLDVARLCGTSVLMIEKHYGHLVADAARDRLARVEIL